MTFLSWVYMLLVWAAIVALNIFCFRRIIMKNNAQNEDQEKQGGRDAQ